MGWYLTEMQLKAGKKFESKIAKSDSVDEMLHRRKGIDESTSYDNDSP